MERESILDDRQESTPAQTYADSIGDMLECSAIEVTDMMGGFYAREDREQVQAEAFIVILDRLRTLFAKVQAMLAGDANDVRKWFRASHPGLDGATPLSHVTSGRLSQVESLVDVDLRARRDGA